MPDTAAARRYRRCEQSSNGGSHVRHDRRHDHRSTRRPPRRLVRVDDGRWLGGVAAGLGRYFDVNPLVYRIAFAALALAGGTGLLLYLAAWLVIPGERREESIAVEALRGHRDHPWLLARRRPARLRRAPRALRGALLARARATSGSRRLLGGAALVWWHVSRTATATRAAAGRRRRRRRRRLPRARAAPAADADARPPPATAADEAVALRAGRSARSSRPPALFGLLAVLDVYDVDLAVALAAARRDRRRRDRGRGDDAAARRRARLPRAAPARRVRRRGGDAGLGLGAGIGEQDERPVDRRPRSSRATSSASATSTVDLSEVTLPAGHDRRRRRARHRQARSSRCRRTSRSRSTPTRASARSTLSARATTASTRDRASSPCPGSTPDAPVLDLEADVGIGDIEVRRG